MQLLPTLSIFIPLYNEESGIKNLEKELNTLEIEISKFCDLSIVLVDDGSTDNTFSVLNSQFGNKNNYKIVKHEFNKNLGGFIRTSQQLCKTEYIAYLDSDCSYPPNLLIPMFKKTLEKYDVVNASPYHPLGNVIGVENYRLFLSKFINKFYSKLIKKNIYTTSSICKIYKFSLIKNIEITRENFIAITELFIKVLNNKITYFEFPCELKTRQFGVSKMNVASNIIDHLKFSKYLIIEKYKKIK